MSDETYQRIFELNRRWVEERNAEDPTFFEKLAREQNPDFLFIGCADSRVPASTIMGVEPGEVFVTRNVANLVVNTDLNVASTINYAVDHLKVKHVVVCGHYGCGGVMAAMQSKDLGVLNGWLREIRDVYRLHRKELDAIEDKEQRYRRLVELNVREQCLNVIKTAEVQRNFLERGAPTVHGWVYDLSSGLLKDLNVNFEDLLSEVREIYSLTPGERG
ncbi:carbonic anhydrase [Bradymonadaceae bacterium TMQ3]|uniref:carbonic anhydrase n=1 Tax=Lujinxingia sediminis TaxID=2480984 RepID=A0ABY0CY80_9DELT|nr:carbonic anhydrase [Lujinxingia sediminis]RDV39388.1 carbonic anhydrase [Bradymonadaceae bacterium TMQ3]RVU48574.1 carbonic anhydrase [Lujinxingia sediminis]TXC77868.1 carbonic anhydrase [Bradymonadales bacterium TMQ1]